MSGSVETVFATALGLIPFAIGHNAAAMIGTIIIVALCALPKAIRAYAELVWARRRKP